jgi:hypothetical protein
MSKKLKLTKIALETKDGKAVELTIEEAKELHQQLDSLFGEKYLPATPIIIERDRWNPPFQRHWFDITTALPEPRQGGLDVQCAVEGKSGLAVSYFGDAL